MTQTTRRRPRGRSRWQPKPGSAQFGVNGDMPAAASSPARAKVPEPPPDLPPLEPEDLPEEEPEPDEMPAPPGEPEDEPVPA